MPIGRIRKLRNIRWALIFIGQVKSPRDVTTYVPPDQDIRCVFIFIGLCAPGRGTYVSNLLSPPEPLRFSFFLALLRPGSLVPMPRPRPSFFSAHHRSFFSARPASPCPAPPYPGQSLQPAAAASSTPGRLRPAQPRPRLAGAASAAPRSPRPVPPCPSAEVLVPPAAAALISSGSSRCRPTHPPGPRSLPPLLRPSAQAPVGAAPPWPTRAVHRLPRHRQPRPSSSFY
jgi:hypothetical protein